MPLINSVLAEVRLLALLAPPFDVNLRCDDRSHFLKLPFRLAAAAADEFTNALADSSLSLFWLLNDWTSFFETKLLLHLRNSKKC